MVNFVTLIVSAALLSSRALAMPLPDSAINEPGVRSPDGTPVTDGSPAPTNAPAANYGNGGGNYYASSSSSMMEESTTTKKMKDTTSTMAEDTTTTAAPSYTTTTQYGSGYTNWNSDYNGCVQQCMNTYGAPPAMYTAPPSETTTTVDSGNGGSGKTHTVIVAPAQGILRFVPFALNASVGDTVHYEWNGSPHTVTRSSTLLPCNKTLDTEGFFTSGVQNKSFTFDITINDTNTIAYYCGVPGHCEKGMFGFINPPNANAAPSTVASVMPALLANSSSLATQAMYVANKTMGTSAYKWGDNIDMTDVPAELHEQFVQNILQTRLTFSANPGMLETNQGAVNPDGSAVTIPADITQITAANPGGESPSSSTGAPANAAPTVSSSSSTATSTGTPSGSSKTGGAMAKSVASSAAIGIAVLVAFIAL